MGRTCGAINETELTLVAVGLNAQQHAPGRPDGGQQRVLVAEQVEVTDVAVVAELGAAEARVGAVVGGALGLMKDKAWHARRRDQLPNSVPVGRRAVKQYNTT